MDSAEPGKRVKVLFRGNKRGVGCYPSDLSRTWPPPKLPGEYEVGDQVTYSGALLELKALRSSEMAVLPRPLSSSC